MRSAHNLFSIENMNTRSGIAGLVFLHTGLQISLKIRLRIVRIRIANLEPCFIAGMCTDKESLLKILFEI
jgi:hypothetical protein